MKIYLSGRWGARYIRRVFIKEIDTYSRVLSERFLPTVNDEEISKLADRAADEEWRRLGSLPGSEDYDESAAAEAASDVGLEEYQYLQSIRQGVLNTFGAGLYHLFEQQLCNLYRGIVGKTDLQLDTYEAAKLFDTDFGIDSTAFPMWNEIDGVRLLANCVKHGEGKSCQELRKRDPELFRSATEKQMKLPAEPRQFVERPLGGEGIYLTLEEFERRVAIIKEFWLMFGKRLVEIDG
jgi:hypothetical protein